MNKKQICKVSYTSKFDNKKLYDGYGICIGDDLLLLEDGSVLDCKNHSHKESLFLRYGNDDFRRNCCGGAIGVCSVSNTRNVPADIRDAMEQAADSAIAMQKLYDRFDADREKFNRIMEKNNKAIKNMPQTIRQARNTLSVEEFEQAFIDALPENVRYAMEHSAQRNYSGSMEGNFKVNVCSGISNIIQIERHVWIDKWARPSFTYLEYDDTRAMYSDAETYPEYKEYLKKYSKRLPVSPKAEFSEYLTLGDKNSLEYHGMYFITIDDKEPLAKEYAEKLAEEFAGIKRTKNKETYDMER